MSKTAENAPNWVSDWIEQQRKKIEQNGESRGAAAEPAKGFEAFFQNLAHGIQGGPSPGFASPSGGQGFGPPLGLMREHEQAWRDLGEAQARYRQLESELLAQLNAVQLEALALLEQRAASNTIKEMRELYDLWVECGEEVYAKRVRSDDYCKTQAALANAATQLRLKQQAILERALQTFDLPTRTEINTVHRQLRELREKLNELTNPQAQPPSMTRAARAKKTTGKAALKGTRRRASK